IIGRIIQRRASEEVAARHTELTVIGRDRAMRRVAAAFDQQLTNRLVELNRSVDFQVQLAEFRTREGSRRLMACTTPQYLQIADMIYNGQETAIHLPTHRSANEAAPIEVWVHSSVVPSKIGAELKTILTSPDQSAV